MLTRRRRSTLSLAALLLPVLLRIVPAGAAPVTFRGEHLTPVARSTFVMRDLARDSAPGELLPPSAAEEEAAEGVIPDDLPVGPDVVVQDPQPPEGAPDDPEPAAPPTLASNFQAIDDEVASIPPDTNGAVGPSHLLAAHNNRVRIQSRTGAIISTVTHNAFWSASGTFDPRAVYDPYNGRFVVAAVDDAESSTSAILIAASATSDPTGTWYRYRYDADSSNAAWCDFPTLAFHAKWLGVTCNMFSVSTNAFSHARVVLLDRVAVYAGALSPGGTAINNSSAYGGSLAPAVTYDATYATLHLIQAWNGNSGGNGHVRLYTVTGAVGSEVLTIGGLVSVPAPWNSGGSLEDFAPQLGDSRDINLVDHRMQALYRNGSLWATHVVFLPATSPTHAAAQWWEINPATTTLIQRGRVEDTSGTKSYGFPSIAVNANDDALLGYSTFSSSQYAGAGYAVRYATDPLNTFQTDTALKSGEASYFKTYGGGRNRWGDYSASTVDPLNDIDFWTIQEYAWTPTGFIPGCDSSASRCDRWATWWGKVVPNSTAAIISASPAALALGNQRVGTTGTAQTVTVSNTGAENATVGTLSIAGTNPAEFELVSTTCNGATLAPAGSCTAEVRFAPATAGGRAATLRIPHDAPGALTQVPLTGTGTQAVITVTPSSFSFGSVRVSTTSSTVTVAVKDVGTEPLAIATVALGGTHASDFEIVTDTCSGVTLAVNAQCTIGARFTPPVTGARTALVTMTHDGPSGSTSINLTGTGSLPGVALNPASLDFGQRGTGTTSPTSTVTVTNTGGVALTLGQLAKSGANAGDFILSNDTCSGSTRAAGTSCTFRVAFAPSADGARSAQIDIPSDAPGSPHVLPLAGVGVPPAPIVTLSATSVNFGNQYLATTSTTRTVTVSNTGDATLVLGTLSIEGVNPGDYAKAESCSGASIAAGSSCIVSLAFTPSAIGARSAVLAIPNNAAGSPHQVTLSGTGVGDGRISASPNPLEFGNTVVTTTSAPRVLTVTNTGGGPLTITSTPISGSAATRYQVTTNGCTGVQLEVGQSCLLQLRFSPGLTGSQFASLGFTSNAPSPPTVTLIGVGTDPVLSRSPSSLTFAPQRPGQSSSTQRVTISNTGVGPLEQLELTLTGASPGSFQIASETCSATLGAGSSCVADVRFAPASSGSLSAALMLTSNDRTGTKSVALSGLGDGVAPRSSFNTQDGAIVVGGVTQLRGSIMDTLSGVATATLTQRHVSVLVTTITPSLSCDTPRSLCVWTMTAPLAPGLYTYTSRGTDAVGNVESPGATISVIVI